jgi:hypothetical protein
MAISYGVASTGGGAQNFRVGYEITSFVDYSTGGAINSGTATASAEIQFYVRNAAAVTNDTQNFAYTSGTATMSGVTSNSIVNTQTVATDRTIGGPRLVTFDYTTWGSSPGNFTGSITGSAFYVGSNCTHTWSIPIPARPGGVPTAPSSIASYPDDGYVTIVYGNSSPTPDPAASYQYSGDDGASGWNNITTNPFNVVAPNGTPITIYVKAVNAVGSSASVSATSTPRTVPGAPASVTLTPGNGSVSVAYTAPSSNGGNAISSYEYSTNGSTYTTTPSNPFTVSGTNGTSITVYVRARNDAGAGSATSNSATPRTVPSAPQSFAGSNTTFGQLSLSWAAPSSNGGNAVSSYVLRTGSTVLQNTSATSYVHTGLSPYTDYSYTVTAANAAGESTTASLTVKTMGGVAKVWNGTAWVTILPKVWNGTAWVEAQARMWNGTSWVHGI